MYGLKTQFYFDSLSEPAFFPICWNASVIFLRLPIISTPGHFLIRTKRKRLMWTDVLKQYIALSPIATAFSPQRVSLVKTNALYICSLIEN